MTDQELRDLVESIVVQSKKTELLVSQLLVESKRTDEKLKNIDL